MNLLVTGGAGFIGSHVAAVALNRGHSVTIIDDLSSGKRGNVPEGAIFVKDNICSCNWEEMLGDIDTIFHAAAFVSAPESFAHLEKCYDTNVKASWRLIKACVSKRIRKLIFCSSSAIYREDEAPNRETDLPGPGTPYGLTKLDVEHLLAIAKHEYGLSYTALRYFNVFGPRQDLNSNYSAVIPIFINRALNNADLTIYGTGQQRRDFIYVADVANAVLTFARNDSIGAFNVGTGTDYSVLQMADIIIRKTTSSSRIRFEASRPGDVMFSTASLLKQRELGVWAPSVSVEQALDETIRFYQDKSDL
jgi:UDP-glucose 4-epimerase